MVGRLQVEGGQCKVPTHEKECACRCCHPRAVVLATFYACDPTACKEHSRPDDSADVP